MTPDKYPPGYKPSQHMLDEVGLNFDGDVDHSPKPKRPRTSAAWLLLALPLPVILLAIDPAYGFMFISGILVGGLIGFILGNM